MRYQDIALWTGIMLVPALVVVLIPLIHRLRPSPVVRERRKLERREIQAKIQTMLLLEKAAFMRKEGR
jgi:hypothetical protein